ncbi:MAG: glycoside hydrolase family 31 protein [Anaerolineales bacterium]
MAIQRIAYVLRAIGIKGIFRTINYGFYRDRIERKTSHKNIQNKKISPGKLEHAQPIQGGIQLEFENGRLELVYLSTNIIRTSWWPGKPPIPYTIAKNDWEIQKPTINFENTSHRISLGQFEVTIDSLGGITYGDIEGNIFRKDNPAIQDGEGWSLSTLLTPDEHIYGLGERASTFNLRPGVYHSWNTDVGGSYSKGNDPLYIGTPIYLSLSNLGSYLLYFENSYCLKFDIGATFQASFSGGMLRYYVILGSLETIYRQISDLIGPPCMPPRWAFGYHQSRWGYRSESDIREVVSGFENHVLPLSAIHLDIDYMDGFRVFTVNKNRFPAMKQFSNELEAKGIKLVASINPAVKRDRKYKIYLEGLSEDIFCKLPDGELFTGVSWSGWSVFPDFTKPEARIWWQKQYSALLSNGIAGIWHDMNEPSSFAAWGDKTFPSSVSHSLENQNGNHQEAHNLYGLLMNQAGFEGIRNYAPHKRPWIFSRAGWAGLQRYAWNWTGDVESTWEAFQQTIPIILGLGLSGHFFSGVDIGGFSGNPSAELYLRWFQMASFFPLFRTHSAVGTKRREPWVFGEPTTSIIREFLRLRYKLIPYLYTLAWETVQTGIPPIRPLLWDDPQNRTLWDIGDEFFVGSSLLIAPVLQEKAQTRLVTFPRGSWYSFWDDQEYRGVTQSEMSVNLKTIPIFIKAGTLLPMEENNEIIFHVYPAIEGISRNRIYFDSGDGYGTWRVDTFQIINSHNSVYITWDKEGEYTFPYSRVEVQVHGRKIKKVLIDNESASFHNNLFDTPIFQNLKLDFN